MFSNFCWRYKLHRAVDALSQRRLRKASRTYVPCPVLLYFEDVFISEIRCAYSLAISQWAVAELENEAEFPLPLPENPVAVR